MKRVLGADPVIWQQREGVTVLAKAHGLYLQQKTFVHPVTGEAQIAVYEMEQHEFWLVYRKGAIRVVETVMAAFNAARLGHIVWPDR